MVTDYEIAKRRGERAAKLFSKKSVMEAAIAALKKEDAHRADPTKPSGMSDFYAACQQAIKKGDDVGVPSDSDVQGFIKDLWDDVWVSRSRQESRPCW